MEVPSANNLLFSASSVLLGIWLGLGSGCDQAGKASTAAAPAMAAPVRAASAPAAALAKPVPKGPPPAKYGEALSTSEALPAAELISEPDKFIDKPVKLVGRVSQACQRRGCWMTVGSGEPGAPTVRVTFKDKAFTVPIDCSGKVAVIEGRVKVTTTSAAEAQNDADDAILAGAAPQKVTGPQRSLAMVASGVELSED